MNPQVSYEHFGLHLVIRVADDGGARLAHLGMEPFEEHLVRPHEEKMFRLLEVQCAGENYNDHHGLKHTGTNPGQKLKYQSHRFEPAENGVILCVEQAGGGIKAQSIITFLAEIPAVSVRHVLEAEAGASPCLEYVSSLSLCGIEGTSEIPEDRCSISFARNSWCAELQWQRITLSEAGLSPIIRRERLHATEEYKNFSTGTFRLSGHGTWPSGEFLPMGAFERDGSAIAWQIESSGAWQWEISTIMGRYYLQAAGPDNMLHHWNRTLGENDRFITESVTAAFSKGNREDALRTLNLARRHIYRKSPDLQKLPVIFNEYMSSMAEPCEENLLPLISAAAKIGSEYFCIDAGWYCKENRWWDDVGHWEPEESRFPHGLSFVMDKIRDAGMLPGIWLEPEVMGIDCKDASKLPDEAYFVRNGRRVIDHGRFQLDFRHHDVREMLDGVVDRLVSEYGIGYLKLDYNINGGYGTIINTESAGNALLEHTRAYRAWLCSVLERHSGLIIENCASGGMRITYALLSLLDVQSVSDQDDPLLIAPIAAAAPTAVTPEQAAVWCLPRPGQDDEAIVFSMVNALLMRLHQSADITALSDGQIRLIAEAIAVYKTYRENLPEASPFWPLGLPEVKQETICLGVELENEALLAVWRYKAGEEKIPLPAKYSRVSQIYPASMLGEYEIGGGELSLKLPSAPAARLLRLW